MSADPAPVCPVCQWPAPEAAACGNCGARLLGGYVVGPPPPHAQAELDRALAGERRRHALRVAVRAAAWRGDDRLTSLAQLADGGRPASDAEVEDAKAAYREEESPYPAAPGVGLTLSRLVAGDTDAIEFVEVSPDGLAAYALVADEFGVPVPRPGGQVYWTDILPELPPDDDLRTYLLAGGWVDPAVSADPGPADPALAIAVAAAAEREIDGLVRAMTRGLRPAGPANGPGGDVGMALPPLANPDTVLVRRTQGWPSLEMAAARARTVLRPIAEIFAPGTDPLSEIVGDAVKRAPLRYDYCLVLADISQQTGRVWPFASELFPAGTAGAPQVLLVKDIAVMAPSGATDRLMLPVVVRRGNDPAGWPAVSVGTMDGTAAGVTQLRIRLDAPGRVSMSASPRLVSGDGMPGWPSVLDGLPGRMPGAVVADVVLLAELGGRPETIADRMSLLDGVVGELERAGGVRVAVIGYREHRDRYPMADGLIVGCDFGNAADIRPVLALDDLWKAVVIRDVHAAPLEDALDRIAQPDWAWRPGVRHLVVVFASRPPHPSEIDARGQLQAIPCQAGLDWQAILDRLRQKQAVECIAVLPERTARTKGDSHTERAWAELGTAGLLYAEQSPTADLLRAIGIDRVDEDARLPLAVAPPDTEPQDGSWREGGR